MFKIIEYRDPAEVISDEYPVWLTTGRRLQSYHTRTQTGSGRRHRLSLVGGDAGSPSRGRGRLGADRRWFRHGSPAQGGASA